MNRPQVMGGDWPGLVTFHQGWAKAHARPQRDSSTAAVLRLERGGSGFLRSCKEWLFEAGSPAVISGPVSRSARYVWAMAGFDPEYELLMMRRDLKEHCPAPALEAREASSSHWDRAIEIDNQAFAPDWQVGGLGLRDAAAATPVSQLLVCEQEGKVDGFAIIGVSGQTGYLQRLAVAPSRRGVGIGRSLLRAGVRWAQSRRARSMLLNTQPGNLAAISLYEGDGFELLPERLLLLKATLDTTR